MLHHRLIRLTFLYLSPDHLRLMLPFADVTLFSPPPPMLFRRHAAADDGAIFSD